MKPQEHKRRPIAPGTILLTMGRKSREKREHHRGNRAELPAAMRFSVLRRSRSLANAQMSLMARTLRAASTRPATAAAVASDLLSRAPALPVLARLAARAFVGEPEAYKEYLAPTAQSIEFPTWLYLVSPPETLLGDLSEDDLDRISAASDEAINAAMMEMIKTAPRPEAGPMATLSFRTRIDHLVVRIPGTDPTCRLNSAECSVASGLIFAMLVGFTIEEALKFDVSHSGNRPTPH